MALKKGKVSEIPPDAVMLSEEDAMKYHYGILNNWKIKSDVFGYNYGTLFLSAATVLSGAYINNQFRTKLKLFSYGRIATYLPICVVPATMTFLLHHESVLKQLVLLKQEQCPICLELRASTIQSFFGLLMPLAIAPMSSIGLAQRYATYNVPHIIHKPLEVFRLVRNLIKPMKNVLFGIFVGHALLGSVVTYLEARSIYNVHSKLAELERRLENSDQM